MEEFDADLERVAIHEAGHVVAAAVEGYRARAFIEESNTDNPIERKLIVGQCEYGQFLTAIPPSPVVSVAGAVAECLSDNDDYDTLKILEFID